MNYDKLLFFQVHGLQSPVQFLKTKNSYCFPETIKTVTSVRTQLWCAKDTIIQESTGFLHKIDTNECMMVDLTSHIPIPCYETSAERFYGE